jgi:energy-coupling factor transport system permease protein
MYPTIAADSQNIMDSMRARGVEFDQGRFLSKVRARANVVMPLLFNSLDRSIAIAEAMETRGFGAGKRTNYSETRLTSRQKWMVASFVCSIIVGIVLFVFGFGNSDYLNGAGFDYGLGDVAVLAAYVILLSPIMYGGGR